MFLLLVHDNSILRVHILEQQQMFEYSNICCANIRPHHIIHIHLNDNDNNNNNKYKCIHFICFFFLSFSLTIKFECKQYIIIIKSDRQILAACESNCDHSFGYLADH